MLILRIDYAASLYQPESIDRYRKIFCAAVEVLVRYTDEEKASIGELVRKISGMSGEGGFMSENWWLKWLKYVFMHTLGWGIKGAAIAAAIGYIIPLLYCVWFYSPVGGSTYRLRPVKPEPKKLLRLCGNGASEMVSNLAAGLTALFMNRLIYRFHGE